MNPTIALLLVPLLIWVGVFAFVYAVDSRLRRIERLVAQDSLRSTTPLPAATLAEKETQPR